jgi:hypothetical protein
LLSSGLYFSADYWSTTISTVDCNVFLYAFVDVVYLLRVINATFVDIFAGGAAELGVVFFNAGCFWGDTGLTDSVADV